MTQLEYYNQDLNSLTHINELIAQFGAGTITITQLWDTLDNHYKFITNEQNEQNLITA